MKLQSGQHAVVTGASRGLGFEIARALGRRGVTVTLVARSEGALRQAAATLADEGITAHVVACDLAEPAAARWLAAGVRKIGGVVDVLVNNAGVERAAAYQVRAAGEIQADIALNLSAPMQLTHALLPGMIARGHGHIVNVASIAGLVPMPYQEPYCATKAGLIAFSRALRLTARAAGWGVGVSALCPGFITGDGMFERLVRDHDLSPDELGAATIGEVGEATLRAIEDDLALAVVGDPATPHAAAAAIVDPATFDDQLLQSPAARLFKRLASGSNA